jgi:hypothetical protein
MSKCEMDRLATPTAASVWHLKPTPTAASDSPSKMEEEELAPDEYFVEAILGRRRHTYSSKRRGLKGFWEYLVKWEGYDAPTDNTWEPKANLTCTEKLQAFQDAHLDSDDEGATKPTCWAPAPSSSDDEDNQDDEDDEEDLGNPLKKFWGKRALHPTGFSRLHPSMRLFAEPPAAFNQKGHKGWGMCCFDAPGGVHCEHNVPLNGCGGKCENNLCDL